MEIKRAKFICSSSKTSQLPQGDKLEFALIGRSNVGKSSLINMLCSVKQLAKVSGTPGKTRLINHFLVNDDWYLVDLPGYGYARTSKTNRKEFASIITDYIKNSENLYYLFILVDIRHEPQKIDMEFFKHVSTLGRPFGLIFTKEDKLTVNQAASSIARYKRVMKQEWDQLPDMFITSAFKRTGKEPIVNFIGDCIKMSKEKSKEAL